MNFKLLSKKLFHKNLSVGELTQFVYEELYRKNSQEIQFKEPILAVIADDSDDHRSRTGYMRYEKGKIVSLNRGRLIISRGEACGDYPADPYNSDIMAIPERIIEAGLEGACGYFTCSLIVGMSDGRLVVPKGNEELKRQVSENIESFVAQKLKTRLDLMYPDQRPVVTNAVRYKPGVVDFLVRNIEECLNL